MSTALFELAGSVTGRVGELYRLTSHAKEYENKNEFLYNSICRSTSVLLASHLEGFIKDLTRSITVDLNYYVGSFSEIPAALQRTFCEKIAFYEGVEKKQIDERIKQLIAFFNKNSVPIDLKIITYKEAANNNPTAAFIDSTMSKFGIPDIVKSISGSKFDAVFDNDTRYRYTLNRDLKRFQSLFYHFPYRSLPELYQINFRSGNRRTTPTLWHAYIDEMMTRRHSVAHGDTQENDTTWEALEQDTHKLEVLMHALLHSSAAFLSKS